MFSCMKYILSTICLANLFIWNAFSQNFPLDPSGEILFQEVVQVDSLKKMDAYWKGVKWLNSLNDEQITLTKQDSLEGKLNANSFFFVYDQAGVFKKLSGKISYSISIDVKDDKYRYSFTDFLFHYYKQDRNYNMVGTGKTKNLKDTEAKGWQKLWTRHRISTNAQLKRNIELLKTTMKESPVIKNKKAQVKKVEW